MRVTPSAVQQDTPVAHSGFSEGARVVVEELDDVDWKVREPFSYTGKRGVPFNVYDGMETDFASVPRVFVWFLPRYGAYTKAAIVHDLLWRELVPRGDLDYIDADGIFRRAMRELGVPFLRRWIMWAAVRWGALAKPGGRKGWWRESWRVLLVTFVALPVVVPPAAIILVALLLYLVIEALLWIPLKLASTVRARRNRPTKQVNAPSIDWRLS